MSINAPSHTAHAYKRGEANLTGPKRTIRIRTIRNHFRGVADALAGHTLLSTRRT